MIKPSFVSKSIMSNTMFPKIMNASIAKEAWKILQDEFQGSNIIR